ncbi:MAG TPA: aromatic ring-hydroxylating dioxygenase subunit alpha [Caulobacteraceae bacterium]|nr:aromatic ring-hydroxylating dioxygenase subunit alpha [Caulobacteraceae bacterium]
MPATLEERLHETRLGLGRRIVEHIRNGSSDLAEGPMRNDASVYTDPVRHAAERRRLFRETPLVACLSNDIREPGSFRTFDETGVPILIVRGRDGQVRAFLNVCTHRGARLVREPEGRARLFTCWFHGWSYAEDGRLAATPEAERFCDALGERSHLIPVPAAERFGLVFVKPTPESSMDIDAHLGDFAPQLELLQLDRAERVKSGVLPVKANWKYALDTYGEGYHFAALHKQTLAPFFRNDITIYDRFGPHHRVLFVSRDMEAWLDKQEEAWGVDHLLGGVHYLFPNTILFAGSVSPGKGYYTTFRHFPGENPGETVTYKTIYAPKGVHSDEYRAEVEAAYDATAHVVETEDYVVAAEGWRNLAHLPPGRTVVYGRQELALQNQHRAIAEAIGMPLPTSASTARAAAE